MILRTLEDYFKEFNTDIYTDEVLSGRNIFIQRWGSDENLCIEITDHNGTSVNIGCYVDICIKTYVVDIKEIVLDYLFDNYLYNNC